jgi:hypothetical protein
MSEDVKVGDWVRHTEFGDGLVLETRGKGEAASVLVSFPDNTRRRLMVKFARLTRLDPSQGHAAKLPTPSDGTPRKSKPRASRKTSES